MRRNGFRNVTDGYRNKGGCGQQLDDEGVTDKNSVTVTVTRRTRCKLLYFRFCYAVTDRGALTGKNKGVGAMESKSTMKTESI